MDAVVSSLVCLGKELQNRVCLYSIRRKLVGSDIDDQLDSIIFSMSHLFFSGAIAEVQILDSIEKYKSKGGGGIFPFLDCVSEHVTLSAWQGEAFDSNRNVIGSIAFLVVLLFFFEAFGKIFLKKMGVNGSLGAAGVLNKLKSGSFISDEAYDAINFMNEYRNSWHTFGVYTPRSGSQVQWRSLKLLKGERVPIPTEKQRLELLSELVDAVIKLDEQREKTK